MRAENVKPEPARWPVPALLQPAEGCDAAVARPGAAIWLVPVDGTPESLAAVRYAVTHACVERIAFHLLNVQPPVMAGDVSVLTSADSILCMRRCAGEEALRAARNLVRAHGFRHASEVVFGVTAEEIVRCAAERGCSKIVMSARRTGVIASVLGRSVSARVIRLSPVPVTIVTSRPPRPGIGEGVRFAWAR